MSACVSPSPDVAASPTPTVEVLLCDGCRCPIGSVWDVLPAEAHAPAWTAHVYSYDLDLFTSGAPPLQAYSATNPSKRRFDLLRLAPHVTVHHTPPTAANTAAVSTAITTTTRAPSLVECSTEEYSTEHSFFTGYAWCYCHCGNCGAFLGWGFAAEGRLQNGTTPTAAATRTRAREDSTPSTATSSRRRVEDEDVDEEGEERAGGGNSGNSGAEEEEDVAASTADEEDTEEDAEVFVSSATGGVTPDFIGVIITNCTGESHYPVASLLHEVAMRERRVRRRQRVNAIAWETQRLLQQMDDGVHAHRLLYAMEMVRKQVLRLPPNMDGDEVMEPLKKVLEMAQAAVAQQLAGSRASVESDGEDDASASNASTRGDAPS